MKVSFRNKVDQLGQKGRRAEGQVLREAGEIVADNIADLINRSKTTSEEYKHLADSIVVSRTKSNVFGERHVEIGATKDKAFILKFLELGTSKMNAQAPITIGADMSKDAVAKTLSAGMERILKL